MDEKSYNKFKNSGIENLKKGKYDIAINDLAKCCEYFDIDAEVLSALAVAYLKTGENDIAYDYYHKSLGIDPLQTNTLLEFSKLELSGGSYLNILKLYHEKFNPQRYIEIGVCKGASFGLVSPDATAIGVDPEPQVSTNDLPEKHLVISETSDRYFSSDRILTDFSGNKFDMAFLDGMHLFEYALNDFINLEKYSSSKSVVFVHDLYPINAETAARVRNSDFWSGDVWKLVLCLTQYRPDLELKVLPCSPTGLGVITNLDSTSKVLVDNYEQIIADYVEMAYDVLSKDKKQKLKLTNVEAIDTLFN